MSIDEQIEILQAAIRRGAKFVEVLE